VVDAFRATLEELQEADLLLHVIDITHPKAPEQSQVVDETLDDMGLGEKARLLVVNKMDLMAPPADGLDGADEGLGSLAREATVLVSAAKGWNLDTLLEEIESKLGSMDLLKATAETASD
jgi:GTP-binding protein HflX